MMSIITTNRVANTKFKCASNTESKAGNDIQNATTNVLHNETIDSEPNVIRNHYISNSRRRRGGRNAEGTIPNKASDDNIYK